MGGDGGSTATERKYMRETKENNSNVVECGKSKKYTQMMRSRTCALSNQPLKEPIVCCELGNIYNREALIEALLNKSIFTIKRLSHVRKLKDVRELRLSPNSSSDCQTRANIGKIENELSLGRERCPFVCPITGSEFDGLHPFVAIWTTGYVISESALRELGESTLQTDFGPFQYNNDPNNYEKTTDVIRLLPSSDEEINTAVMNMERRRQSLIRKKGKACTELEVDQAASHRKRRRDTDIDTKETFDNLEKSVGIMSEQSDLSIDISPTGSIVKEVKQTLKEKTSSSATFKSLFH